MDADWRFNRVKRNQTESTETISLGAVTKRLNDGPIKLGKVARVFKIFIVIGGYVVGMLNRFVTRMLSLFQS